LDQVPIPRAFKIIDVTVESHNVKTFTLDGSLAAEPGQFVMVWLPDSEDRPYSLAEANPMLPAVRRAFPARELRSVLYLVHPGDAAVGLVRPGDGCPYVEAATL